MTPKSARHKAQKGTIEQRNENNGNTEPIPHVNSCITPPRIQNEPMWRNDQTLALVNAHEERMKSTVIREDQSSRNAPLKLNWDPSHVEIAHKYAIGLQKRDVIFEGNELRLDMMLEDSATKLSGFDPVSTQEDRWETTIGDWGSDHLAANMTFSRMFLCPFGVGGVTPKPSTAVIDMQHGPMPSSQQNPITKQRLTTPFPLHPPTKTTQVGQKSIDEGGGEYNEGVI
ncbi:hypothetical protein C8J56DRAFT_886558 [Mycena floridula]|nr:hypothetical protein C8J56DRAFT_886558 [Mycena floridula]